MRTHRGVFHFLNDERLEAISRAIFVSQSGSEVLNNIICLSYIVIL